MKTLKSIIVAAAGLFSFPVAAQELPGREAPRVVVERLIGFQIHSSGNYIKFAWDLNKDNIEDLAVHYTLTINPSGFYVGKPFMYKQDLNNNGTYEKDETFRFAQK